MYEFVWLNMFDLFDSSCSILLNFVSICLNLLNFVCLPLTHAVMHKFCACFRIAFKWCMVAEIFKKQFATYGFCFPRQNLIKPICKYLGKGCMLFKIQGSISGLSQYKSNFCSFCVEISKTRPTSFETPCCNL